MSTVVLDAHSKAYPSISLRIRASVFLESDPFALIATLIDDTPGHPARIWHFPGLPRANYGFSLDVIDAGGNPVQNLALFSVVPSQIEGMLSRNDEQINVGLTPGFNPNVNEVFFDGGETSPGSGLFRPDYIGWSIVPSEISGRGLLIEGVDYSWNETTGQFLLLQPGDVFTDGTFFHIHFDPNLDQGGASVPTVIDFSIRVVSEDEAILISDFGNTIIAEPSGTYLELTLPDISTIPVGRPVSIEVDKAIGDAVKCVRVLPNGADVINFLRGKIFMVSNDKLKIYRHRRADLSNEWRVRDEVGNFATVGQNISHDAVQAGVVCAQRLDGSSKNKFQYARIYEEIVLQLPGTQVCNYDDWATGNNKYLYSLANSSNPADVNKFRFPDRRGLFQRNNNAGKAGDYADDSIKNHTHPVNPPSSNSTSGWGKSATGNDPLGGDGPITQYNTGNNNGGGTETAPKHYLINQYVLI